MGLDLSGIRPDFLEAGTAGPLVVLVHSGGSNARQWRRLMEDLKDRYRVRAVNLFGYGATPPWPAGALQSIEDQAHLVERAIPADADKVCLIGHSLGGLIAMKLAAQLGDRVTKLVLLEANPFKLLEQAGRREAFAEIVSLRDCVKECGSRGEWEIAAERFADYWGGADSWKGMSPERRAAFAQALRPNFHEWDAVMGETTPVEKWARVLPRATLAVYDPGTVLPIREIAAILRAARPAWRHQEVPGVGHMGPLTRPDVINPIIGSFLDAHAGTPS
jgi:pimeloyl-ACP methyl ester carboxylesterase